MRKKYSDKELLEKLKRDKEERDVALHFLCTDKELRVKAFGVINSLLIDKEATKEIFHDSLIILLNNVKKGAFHGKSKLETYLIGICKKRCLKYNEQTKKRAIKIHQVPSPEIRESNPEELLITLESDKKWAQAKRRIYKKLNLNCRKILRAFYQYEKSLVEIAGDMGWTKSETAKSSLYRCRVKLRELIQNDKEAQSIINSRL